MDRRKFIVKGLSTAIAGSLIVESNFNNSGILAAQPDATTPLPKPHPRMAINCHRFGVNYTPPRNWWFCWNDWDTEPIKRDLDAISALGADHMRILLIWPDFQPNAAWVSDAHLERLDELLSLMAKVNLDAVITVFTGQLSGLFFMPPFSKSLSTFYTEPFMWDAQELLIRKLAVLVEGHENVLGFDLGNEINTCWQAEPKVGDAWMAKMFTLMESVCPNGVHVNGVDHQPWFRTTTFSPEALAHRPLPATHSYPYWTGALKFGGPMDPPSVKLLAAMATLIRSYGGDPLKPVWAGEFNSCIESLTQQGQAEWLQKSVLAAIGAGVSWFTYWDSHDMNRKFAFDRVEYSLGLLTNDGKVKDQGRAFKELADSFRGKPVGFPSATLPQPPAERNAQATWDWMLDWMEWKPNGGTQQSAG